jgi:hypothetical protein
LKIIAIFRKPADRLAALYQHWRSAPVRDDFGPAHPVRLASSMSIADFFARSEIRKLPEVNNIYLRIFGSSLSQPIDRSPTRQADELAALEIARTRIRALDGIGLTDKMKESVELICRSAGFPAPEKLEAVEESATERDGRLAGVLEDLIRYDEILFGAAVQEFDRRAGAPASARQA